MSDPAKELAEHVLSLRMITPAGLFARDLARKVLGTQSGPSPDLVAINTNGTTRFIPRDEPVFLLRGQDQVAADAVECWATFAEDSGASSDIVKSARDHADKMRAWSPKKLPDLPK